MRTLLPRRSVRLLGGAAALLLTVSACGYGSEGSDSSGSSGSSGSGSGSGSAGSDAASLSTDQVNIGYFANITHATALIGLDDDGAIRQELGGTEINTQVFNAGPSAIEALNAGAVDLTFIGPNPAVNGFAQSGGQALRVVAGAASGGASLVVNPDTVDGLDDLAGKSIATPQLGNTQDVALLNYLVGEGFEVDPATGRGDVTVLRIPNAEIPNAYESGAIDGAWVPEPSAANLLTRGAETLLDEGELWEDGRYVVTHLIASQSFLEEHPDVVEAVIRGLVTTTDWINDNPEDAKAEANAALEALNGSPLPQDVLDPAFANVEFLYDPIATSLRDGADHAVAAGLLDETDLTGIYDLTLLNKVLTDAGKPEITEDGGLGVR